MVRSVRGLAGHERIAAVGLILGFTILVTGAVAIYLTGFNALHNRLRLLMPAVLGSVRMPTLRPSELVVAAAIVVMTIAFVALLIHDARQPVSTQTPPT
jgi:hypothetical protein